MSGTVAQETAGKVLNGTCGWSDASLVRCGRFYPSSVRSAEDKLRTYSQAFPCVEVDSSCYAIPRPAVTAKWAAAVAPGFKFHFKAFSILCGQRVPRECLPTQLRPLLPPKLQQGAQRIGMADLPAPLQDRLWKDWHEALEPVIKASVMGCVLFQFQISFAPCRSNQEYIRQVRARLDPRVHMAVEFRNRGWFVEEGQRQPTVRLLTELGACLVASDDLQHEMFQKDREQTGLPPGAKRIILPIALDVTQPAFGYVRVHRRHGTSDRLLPQNEIQDWAERLRQYSADLRGPVYFLWGTDWEDAPIVNAKALEQALGPGHTYDWRSAVASRPRPGTILALLGAKPKPANRAAAAPEAAAEPNQAAAPANQPASQAAAAAEAAAEPAAAPPAAASGAATTGTSRVAVPPSSSILALLRATPKPKSPASAAAAPPPPPPAAAPPAAATAAGPPSAATSPPAPPLTRAAAADRAAPGAEAAAQGAANTAPGTEVAPPPSSSCSPGRAPAADGTAPSRTRGPAQPAAAGAGAQSASAGTAPASVGAGAKSASASAGAESASAGAGTGSGTAGDAAALATASATGAAAGAGAGPQADAGPAPGLGSEPGSEAAARQAAQASTSGRPPTGGAGPGSGPVPRGDTAPNVAPSGAALSAAAAGSAARRRSRGGAGPSASSSVQKTAAAAAAGCGAPNQSD